MPSANSVLPANDFNAPNDERGAEEEGSKINPDSYPQSSSPDRNLLGDFLSHLVIEPNRMERSYILREGGSLMAERDDIREEIKDKLALAEARTDTKITVLSGKIDLVISKIDSGREENRGTRNNIWLVGFGLAALFIAIAVAFPVFVDMGSRLRDIVREEVKVSIPKTP